MRPGDALGLGVENGSSTVTVDDAHLAASLSNTAVEAVPGDGG
ncbi:hypothetical protein [Corynebacterium cystitidis]|nr:hypothetical protein [Corynebacterium cystitidis]